MSLTQQWALLVPCVWDDGFHDVPRQTQARFNKMCALISGQPRSSPFQSHKGQPRMVVVMRTWQKTSDELPNVSNKSPALFKTARVYGALRDPSLRTGEGGAQLP